MDNGRAAAAAPAPAPAPAPLPPAASAGVPEVMSAVEEGVVALLGAREDDVVGYACRCLARMAVSGKRRREGVRSPRGAGSCSQDQEHFGPGAPSKSAQLLTAASVARRVPIMTSVALCGRCVGCNSPGAKAAFTRCHNLRPVYGCGRPFSLATTPASHAGAEACTPCVDFQQGLVDLSRR